MPAGNVLYTYDMNLGKCDGKVRDLLSKATDQGFRIERDKKSFKIYPTDKAKEMIMVSSTPSDTNFYWELRRHLRRGGFQE